MLLAAASLRWRRAAKLAIAAGLAIQSHCLAATYNVDVVDFEFVPNNLVIAPGDTVVWHAGAADHTVTADDSSFDSSPPPEVATLPIGSVFSHTFTTVGIKHYYCRIHGKPVTQAAAIAAAGGVIAYSTPDDSMTGIIRVSDPSLNTPPETPHNSTPGAGALKVSITPLLQASEFSDTDADDSHAASQWIVRNAVSGEIVEDTGADTANLTELRTQRLAASTAYEWQVRYRDDRGAWSDYSNPTQFAVAAGAGAGTGLMGTYFAFDPKRNMITRQAASRLDPVLDFEWALGKPHPLAPANNFFVYWEGSILPKFSEEYRIRIKADGGVRLWINNQLVIDDPVAATFAIYRSGTVTLEADIPSTIRIEYFDTIASASMHLRWSSLRQPLEVIPQARLFPTP